MTKWFPGLSSTTPLTSHIDTKTDKSPSLLTLQQTSTEAKTIQTMSFDELKHQKEKHVSENNKELAIKYLTKMIPLCDDLEEQSVLMLELADLQFDCGRFPDAETAYQNFCTMFPGDPNIEYALYRSTACCFETLLEADRDQTKTHKAIELANSFLERKETFSTYIDQVQSIRTNCYKLLIESELSIINDYLNRKRASEAERRIEYSRNTLLPEINDPETALLILEDMYKAQQRVDLVYANSASNTSNS